MQRCSSSYEPGGEGGLHGHPAEQEVFRRSRPKRFRGLARKESSAAALPSPNASQVPLRPIDSDNIDDLADDILAEEEADDLLEELTLTGI